MTIYERPAKSLLTDWAVENLRPGQTFIKDDAVRWFAQRYPKIKSATINAHVEIMATNNHLRKHYPSVKPGSGHDLFYKLGPNEFRLWKKDTDPNPRYKQDFENDQFPRDYYLEQPRQECSDIEQPRPSASPVGLRAVASKIFEFARNPAGFLGGRTVKASHVASHDVSGARLPRVTPTRPHDDLDLTHSIVLISCVKSKLPHAAPARALYTSTWFRRARDLVEGSGARWFLLSSLYGLVAPEVEIAPYDYTLNNLGVAERRAWASKVLDQLLPAIVDEQRVVMLAGHRYREFLVEPLQRHGITVVEPTAHLRRGEQLAWLSETE